MLENYSLMFKGTEIGKITYDTEKDSFSYEKSDGADTVSDYSGYPPGLYTTGLHGKVNKDYKPTGKDVEDFLSDRVIPPNRDGIDEFLREKLGMYWYDMWELNKYTRSMCMEDYFWIRKDESEVYEELHFRYLVETGQRDKLKDLKDRGTLPI